MNDQTDQQLLRDYAERQSEAAFAELVRRRVDLVYSAAIRMVGDPHLARDVTQAVFVALAQNARQLMDHPVVSGWLHRAAQNTASKIVRTDVRRRAREQEAAAMNELLSAEPNIVWQNIAPHLDAALGELSEPDRDAVLLRYFERKSAREMAQILGISDEAAQKRVTRAVERLREFFAKRGLSVGAGGLVIVISANAIQAAPAGLAVSVSAAALAGTTIAATTIATHATMSWINLKSITAIAAAALAAGLGAHLVQQRETNRLRSENQNLLAQQEQLSANQSVTLSPAPNQNELERSRADQADLLRLRSEVGTLRAQLKELDQLRAENQQLKSSVSETAEAVAQKKADLDADPAKQAAMAKMNDAKMLVLGLIMYAADNEKQLPADFNQTSNYLANANLTLTDLNQFELVLHGSLTNVASPAETIAVREKQAWFTNGNWTKTYGFADGHVIVHTEPGGNFDAWEKQHMLTQPNQ